MPPMMPSVFIAFLPVGDVRPPYLLTLRRAGALPLATPPAFFRESWAKNFIRLRACGSAAVRARTEQFAGRALNAPGQLSKRQLACARGAVCCGKEAGKIPAKLPARTCISVLHKRERQLAAPWRDLLSGSTRLVSQPPLSLAAPCFRNSAYTSQNSGTGSSCSAPTASRSGPPRSSRSGTPCPPLSKPWPRPSRSRF